MSLFRIHSRTCGLSTRMVLRRVLVTKKSGLLIKAKQNIKVYMPALERKAEIQRHYKHLHIDVVSKSFLP